MTTKFTPVHARRLQTLADLLRVIPEDNFNLNSWINPCSPNYDRVDLDFARKEPDQLYACGTVACAVGWAASIKEFRRAGFKINRGSPYFQGKKDRPFYKGWSAAEAFFGLSGNKAEYLFMDIKYPTKTATKPQDVCKRIESLLQAKARAASA